MAKSPATQCLPFDPNDLATALVRAPCDLRTIARALAAAGQHAAALRMMGLQAIVEHEVPEQLAAGEAKLGAASGQMGKNRKQAS